MRLKLQLASLQQVKVDGKISPAFIAKVALSHPQVSVRGFAQAWTDLVGPKGKGQGCGRDTIGRIRDAFAEVAMNVVHDDARAVVSTRAREFASAHSDSAVARGARELQRKMFLHRVAAPTRRSILTVALV